MISSRFALLSLFALSVSAAACRSSAPAAHLPSFQDVSSAPSPIQAAARAVVRIETAGEAATGSFLSATGLLLTNNHVLGVPVCAVEGCNLQLTFLYQRGEPLQAAQPVFAVPVAVDVGLDMALVQVYASKGGQTLATPDFLTLEAHDAASLRGTHVNLVGHPEAELKKWTSGDVIDSDGDWIWTDAYILPGDSGSPILNDAGKMVGIIHRAPTSQDLFTSTGDDTYSIGTASASLMAAMKAPLPSAMISVLAPATPAQVVANDVVYLNAHATSATPPSDGTTLASPFDVLEALGTACDAGLARTNYASPEDLSTALTPCTDAMMWIECRSDAQGGFAVECPGVADAASWVSRFQALNDHWRALNGELDLDGLTYGEAALQSNMAAGVATGAANLTSALSLAGAPLDLDVATYLAAFNVGSYGGVATLAYVTAYTQIPDYALNASSIVDAALWLDNDGVMTADACKGLLAALASDPSVDVGAKLYIEAVQYNSGIIQ